MAGTVTLDSVALHEMYTDPDGPVAQIVEQKCLKVETVAKVLVTIPGTGRTYEPGSYTFRKHGKLYHWVRTRPAHTASAPGEPPSSDSGRLLTAITHRIIVGDTSVYGEVVANVNYAHYLELGTSLMEPRPFLRPALSAGMA